MNDKPISEVQKYVGFQEKKAMVMAGAEIIKRLTSLTSLKEKLTGFDTDGEFSFENSKQEKSVIIPEDLNREDNMGRLMQLGIEERIRELKKQFEEL